MAMATSRIAEMATSTAVVCVGATQSRFQQGQVLKVQLPCSEAACRRRSAAMAVSAEQQMADGEESPVKRASLMSTAMALAGAIIVAGGVAGNADAALQKVEGTERGEQDAVTTGIREPSRLSAAKGNTVQEGAKTNTQASGGTILGVPRLEVPGGAYRSPQSGTYSLEEAGSKKSTPAGLLQGREQGDGSSEGSETFEIGGDAKAK